MVSTFAAGPAGNAAWDGIKVVLDYLAVAPLRRRAVAREIERRSRVPLRYQRFARRLSSDEAFVFLRANNMASLGVLLQQCIHDGHRTRENGELIARESRRYLLETWPRAESLGLSALDAIGAVSGEIEQFSIRLDELLGRSHRLPVLGPDPLVWELRADELFDRDEDLDNLSFIMRDSPGGYAIVRGRPWAGKTALMCEMAVEPPLNVDVVSFFVRRVGGRNSAADFLEVVTRQLRSITGIPIEPGEDFARRRATFYELWRQAVATANAADRNLCLLVDGLDEQREEDVPISALLPRRVGRNVLVLIATRDNPSAFPGVEVDHEIHDALANSYELLPSEHVRDVKSRADLAVAELVDDPGSAASRCFGMLAIAAGGLTKDDLSVLTGDTTKQEVSKAVQRIENLTKGVGSAEVPWRLAHESLLDALDRFDSEWVSEQQEQFVAWVDSWRSSRWPLNTPGYLLSEYWRTVDPANRDMLARDWEFVLRASRHRGGRLGMLHLTETALQRFAAAEPIDRRAITQVGFSRVELLREVRALPDGAVAVYSMIGDIEEVLHLVQETTSSVTRARRIREAAPHLAMHHVKYLVGLATEVGDPSSRVKALLEVAAALARYEPADAFNVLTQAIESVDSISDPLARSRALREVAMALADYDPAAALAVRSRALETALSITNPWAQYREMMEVVAALTDHNLAKHALQAVALETDNSFTSRWEWSRALWEVAATQTDRSLTDQERQTAALQTIDAITDPGARSWMLGSVAADIGRHDPATARRLLAKALEAASSIDAWGRDWLLRDIAVAVADRNPNNPALLTPALEVANGISNPWAQRSALGKVAAALLDDNSAARALLEQVLDTANSIPNPQARGETLIKVAAALSAHDPAVALEVLAEALEAVNTISNQGVQGRALREVAVAFTEHDPSDSSLLATAVETVKTIIDPWTRSWALRDVVATVAEHEPTGPAVLAQALETAQTITNPWARNWALREVATAIAKYDPTDSALLSKAIKTAESISNQSHLSRALVEIAASLARSDPAKAHAVLAQAVEVANTITDQREESHALWKITAALARHDPATARLMLRQALLAANSASLPLSWALQKIEAASEMVPSTTDPQPQIQSVVAVHNQSQDPSLLIQTLEMAVSITDPQAKSWALTDVALMAGNDSSVVRQILDDVLKAADTITEPQAQTRVWWRVAAALADHHPESSALWRAIARLSTYPGLVSQHGDVRDLLIRCDDSALIEDAVRWTLATHH